VVLAFEREPLSTPEPGEHRETLIELLGADAGVGLLAERLEIVADGGAEAHAKDQAPGR
jgi:hypothetical protein